MRHREKFALLAIFLLSSCVFAEARYFTWIDESGNIRNSFIEESAIVSQQLTRRRQLSLSDYTAETNQLLNVSAFLSAPNSQERKRRYFTWIGEDGVVQNSFYPQFQAIPDTSPGGVELLPNGELASDYISSDELERRAFNGGEDEGRFFTWSDGSGRFFNNSVTATPLQAPGANNGQELVFTEGAELAFSEKVITTKAQDINHSSAFASLSEDDALISLLANSNSYLKEQAQHAALTTSVSQSVAPEVATLKSAFLRGCCTGMPDSVFQPLGADRSLAVEVNQFSTQYRFPSGHSYFEAFRLPQSRYVYGLRVRSFAVKDNLLYPSLLFLDKNKKPTRLVSDAVYQRYKETWFRHAYIEGLLKIDPRHDERYVVVLTTEDDLKQQTLDANKQQKKHQEWISRQHLKTGSLELAIVR